jgi:hypothetical protein
VTKNERRAPDGSPGGTGDGGSYRQVPNEAALAYARDDEAPF